MYNAASTVSLDGKRMQMAANEVGQQYTLGLGDDKMMLMWQLERPLYGQALEITTGESPFLRCLGIRLHADRASVPLT